MGIHEDNRDRKLMSAGEMSSKGAKIVAVGASVDLCGPLRAWCSQDNEPRDAYRWTKKTAATSDAFAEPSANIAYGSMGCSHWNQFLNAVNQARPTQIDSLKDQHGRINRTKIFDEDETFRKLAATGLTWNVIKCGFVSRFPMVPRLFSKALNAEHNIAIGETWDQQLSSICSSAALLSEDGDIPWERVKRQIASSQGSHLSDLPQHISFIKKYGGGVKLALIQDSLAYLNLRMPAGRKVSGYWIQKLTQIPITTELAVPLLVHAIFKMHVCCHELDCDDHLSRYVSEGELKSVAAKNQTFALEAEKTLGRLQTVMEVSQRACTLEYGDISVQIAQVVLGKNKEASIADTRLAQAVSASCPSPVLRNVHPVLCLHFVLSSRYVIISYSSHLCSDCYCHCHHPVL